MIVLIMIVAVIYIICNRHILGVKNHNPFSNLWEDNNGKYKLIAKNIMKESMEIFQAENIDFIVMYGTLLGLIRHEGYIIPWDDDIDGCTDIKNIQKILNMKKQFKEKGIGIVEVTIGGNTFIKLFALSEPIISGCKWSWPFIDIFAYEVKNDSVFIDDVGYKKPYKIKYSDMFPLKTNLLEGIPVTLPYNPDSILDVLYPGDWKNTCVSSGWNHRKEKGYSNVHKVKCSDIKKPGYDLFDNCWVINLKRRPDRMNTTKERLDKVGISGKRWEATDAEDEEFKTFYESIPFPKRSIGEVACYTSHKKLWEHISKSNLQYALIFEDDIHFADGITKKSIVDIVDRSVAFDIIYLGHCFSNLPIFNSPDISPGSAQCLHAYIISKKAIDNILSRPDNFSLPIDKITEIHCLSNLCYLSHHVPTSGNVKTFGYGIVHQDPYLGSNLEDKCLKLDTN